jgi:hypothetical protein
MVMGRSAKNISYGSANRAFELKHAQFHDLSIQTPIKLAAKVTCDAAQQPIWREEHPNIFHESTMN